MNRINKKLNQRGDKMAKFPKAAGEAIDIGSRLELFVHDYLIEVMEWVEMYILDQRLFAGKGNPAFNLG
jgi:hypothetical protein